MSTSSHSPTPSGERDVSALKSLLERLRDKDVEAEIDAWGVRTGVLSTRMLSLDIIRDRKEAADVIEAIISQKEPANV